MGKVSEIELRRHDLFNLAALPAVCLMNVLFLLDVVVNGRYSLYELHYLTFLAYVVIDSIWVIVTPSCVASPAVIITHHAVVLLGWNIPVLFDETMQVWCSFGALVEINTFILIARRNMRSNILLQYAFYTTWVILRLILYPLAVPTFIINELQDNITIGKIIYFILMLLLNALNIKWSYDLLSKLGSGSAKKAVVL
jgi:TLC domain